MEEQRMAVRLLRHWNKIRKDQVFPKIQQFNPGPVEDLWSRCFLVSVMPGKRALYTYEYMGEPIIALYGRDMTGLHVDEKMKQFPGAVVFRKMGEVVQDGCPKEDTGYLMNDAGRMIKYRACFLPFGDKKKGITHIIVGMSYRIF